MELRHLRYFLAVAETLNFTRAARAMNTAQPPLSVQIRNLEAELGTPLFLRTNRKVALSPAGRAFLPEAQAIVAAADRAKQQLQDQAAGRLGTLRIATDPSGFSEHVTRKLRKFIRKHRGLRVELQHLDYKMVTASNSSDVRIFQTRTPPDGTLVLETADVCVAVPPKHRLAERPSVDPSDVVGEAFLVAPREIRSPAEEAVLDAVSTGLRPTTIPSLLDKFWEVSLGLGLSACASTDRFLADAKIVLFSEGKRALHTVLEIPPDSQAPAVAALVDFMRP